MNLHESLHTHLAGDDDVAALVGARIFPMLIPQHARGDSARHGCIVYTRIGVSRVVSLCGTDRLMESTLQLDAYAASFSVPKDGAPPALAIARATRRSLVDFRGELGGSGGVIVKDIKLTGELEFTDPDPGLYRISQTYSVWHLDD